MEWPSQRGAAARSRVPEHGAGMCHTESVRVSGERPSGTRYSTAGPELRVRALTVGINYSILKQNAVTY